MSERPNEDAQAEYLRTHADTAKPSNPKDAFGSAKVPVGLAPDTALAEMALAFLEGALKYGRYNWRVVGVRASIYNDAMERHRKKWWNGQDRDPSTRVRELASVMACCAILIDSEICGVLDDDRPPIAPLGQLLDANMEVVAHLKDLFKEHSPVQYTWRDSPGLGPLEPEAQPEGFPGGYSIEVTDPTPEGAARRESPAVTVTFGQPSDSRILADVEAGRKLMGLDPASLSPKTATGADLDAREVPPMGPLQLDCGCVKRCKGHPASFPGNYAQERAASTTADAEFPAAPRAREFDPAD